MTNTDYISLMLSIIGTIAVIISMIILFKQKFDRDKAKKLK